MDAWIARVNNQNFDNIGKYIQRIAESNNNFIAGDHLWVCEYPFRTKEGRKIFADEVMKEFPDSTVDLPDHVVML